MRHHTPFDLAHGGHVLVPVRHPDTYRGAPLYRCVRCHGVLPGWAITAPGWMTVLLGVKHCRELVPALVRGAGPYAPDAAAPAGVCGQVPGPVSWAGPGAANRSVPL